MTYEQFREAAIKKIITRTVNDVKYYICNHGIPNNWMYHDCLNKLFDEREDAIKFCYGIYRDNE